MYVRKPGDSKVNTIPSLVHLFVLFLCKWVSMKLVKTAIKLWPDNPEVKEFYIQRAIDHAITGKHIVRVDPDLIYKK